MKIEDILIKEYHQNINLNKEGAIGREGLTQSGTLALTQVWMLQE